MSLKGFKGSVESKGFWGLFSIFPNRHRRGWRERVCGECVHPRRWVHIDGSSESSVVWCKCTRRGMDVAVAMGCRARRSTGSGTKQARDGGEKGPQVTCSVSSEDAGKAGLRSESRVLRGEARGRNARTFFLMYFFSSSMAHSRPLSVARVHVSASTFGFGGTPRRAKAQSAPEPTISAPRASLEFRF
jgi:hypothetical protein